MYHKKARKYISGLIAQRHRLAKNGTSFRDSAVYSADHLKKLMDYWPYNKDHQMAGFVLRKLDHILNLLPRGNNPAFESEKQKVLELRNEAIIILKR